ncbi:maltose/maltodextrin transport system permease protein [Inhella inkyongensis]|uniref:Maltose/maltodextrin transport system permease protein n=1 Tax=Inhella inkyongensis TaxID=392593 RepID=A0A840S6V1_9BURK|nr:maltose ABC transporter permease MalF [Inhella inkyongensis]MBB5206175.1 maltose/maltodextrin transport system permease protein [Inhella inkyongensis]
MNAATLPRPAPSGLPAWGRWLLVATTALAGVAALYLVFTVVATGQVLLGLGLLLLFASAFVVYGTNVSFAYRYLFPGVAGMLLFVAFPLLYTAQLGFTNYSSSNLLTEERSRDYLLKQTAHNEDEALISELHADGQEFRLVLRRSADGAPAYVSGPLALRSAKLPPVIAMKTPAAASFAVQQPLDLRAVLEHRSVLRQLALQLPDGPGPTLHYVGVRAFAPQQPVWTANPDGSVTETATGTRYAPNRDSGFFENAAGERLQPGFKVTVGWKNYARLFGDADFRGPFVSIFIWTVVFALLTVVFTTAVGMGLAVLLNWEGLRFRTAYRTLLFLPYAVPGFISILVFKGLFNQNFGEINAILDALFGIKPAWFADPFLAKTMILIVNTWLGYPYIMLICTGLLKAIPADLYEASALAGAGPLTNFFKITAPQIVKPLMPLLVSAFAFNFNNFVLIALLTDGRPDFLNTKLPAGQTDILVSYTYRIAFRDSGQDFGLAAAISTLIFVLVAVLSIINLRLTRANQGAK